MQTNHHSEAPALSDSTAALVFSDVLRPNPPLSATTLKRVLLAVVAINAAMMLAFLVQGAWPIAPFLGADVAILAWAFNRASDLSKSEVRVTVTRETFQIVLKPPTRDFSHATLNPRWVRLEVVDVDGQRQQIVLWSHGRGIKLGGFLPLEERIAFAARLKRALAQVRSSGFAS